MRKLLSLLLCLLPALAAAQTQTGRLNGSGMSTFDAVANTQTLALVGATPSVANGNVFKTNNSGATNLTNFLNGHDSQVISVNCGDINTTIVNNATIITSTGSNITCTLNSVYQFIFDAAQGAWVQTKSVGAGGGSSSGNQFSVQIANGAGGFSTGGTSDTGSLFTMKEDMLGYGPNPYTDIRRFGARSVNGNITPSIPGIAASISSGSANATLSNASTFQNNDWVVIYGAGPAHALTTPSAPTVTPSLAAAGTGTGVVVNGLTGATTYTYVIVARTKNQGLTAASAQGVTTTGAAALGSQSVGITSCARANVTVTCTTSGAHGLTVGAMVFIKQASDGTFDGWWQTTTIPDTTHFTFNSGLTTLNGAPTSSTGGSAFWWNCNHITWTAVTNAWQYYIYGRVGGSLVPLGISEPQQGVNHTSWDDFGTTMQGALAFPFFLPNTPPVSATSDSLATQILSGAGTTNVTLANTASTTVASATIVLDAGGAIKAAAGVAGSVYIPFGTFQVNSFLDLTAQSVGIAQAGALTFHDTMNASTLVWNGQNYASSCGFPSFALGCGASNFEGRAYPAVVSKVNLASNLNFSTSANGLGWFVDEGSGMTWQDVYFSGAGGTSDSMGMAIKIVGLQVSNSFPIYLHRVLLSAGGPTVTGSTATPYYFCNQCGQTRLESINMNLRGMYQATAFDVTLKGGRIQGAIMPPLTVLGTGPGFLPASVDMSGYQIDTGAVNCLGAFSANGGGVGPSVTIRDCSPSADVSQPSILTGDTSSGFVISGGGNTADLNTLGNNMTVFGSLSAGAAFSNISRNGGVKAVGKATIGYSMLPIIPIVTVGISGSCVSSCVGAGTYQYQIVAIDSGGRESDPAPKVPATTDGTQTIQICWTPNPGQVANRRFRNGVSDTGGGSGFLFASNCYNDVSSIVYSITTLFPGGSSSSFSSAGMASYAFNLINNTFSHSTAFFTPLTANRTLYYPDISGKMVVTSDINSSFDNFNRANGGLGAAWTSLNGTLSIASNVVSGNQTNQYATSTLNISSTAFPPDQFCEITISSFNATTDFPGCSVRQTSAFVWYGLVTSTTSWAIIRRNSQFANSTVASGALTAVNGDVFRLEVQGSTLTAYQNGVVLGNGTESALTGGSCGIVIFGNVATVDNFSCGALHPLAHLDIEQDVTRTQHMLGGITVGASISPTLSRYGRYTATLTPAAVAANTCAAQTFTVTGALAADILIAINKPTEQAGLSSTPGHVTGANSATVNFCNNTAAPITPTAAEVYNFIVVQ